MVSAHVSASLIGQPILKTRRIQISIEDLQLPTYPTGRQGDRSTNQENDSNNYRFNHLSLLRVVAP
jgi:hypothetical protein